MTLVPCRAQSTIHKCVSFVGQICVWLALAGLAGLMQLDPTPLSRSLEVVTTFPRGIVALVAVTSLSACSDRAPQASSGEAPVRSDRVDLSPASWEAGDLDRFRELQMTFGEAQQLVESDESMIAGITAALAVRAGQEALSQGGSAADAAMTTTLAEIVLTAGSSVTLAGEMVMLYYEAASGQVHSMSATYNSILGEDDPASIPPQGTPSGRATLVPGVMAGVEAAHERFGRLPWASIVEPAIYFAEEGFEVDAARERLIDQRYDVITRYPEGRAIFLKEDGTPYRAGDWFRQPAMAATLRRFAEEGSGYFYRGEWGEHLVAAVQALDGRMTHEDLEAYEAIWSDPVSTSFRGYDVYGAGLPSYGGVNMVEALNVFEAAGGADLGQPDQEPMALLRLMQIAQLADQLSPPLIGSFPPAEVLASGMPGVDLSAESRSRKSTARSIWSFMREAEWANFQRAVAEARAGDSEAVENLTSGFGRRRPSIDTVGTEPPRHTAGVVVFDAYGDVAVVLHSINSSQWGDTGLFVGGVSIPDAGAFQQALIAAVAQARACLNGTRRRSCYATERRISARSRSERRTTR